MGRCGVTCNEGDVLRPKLPNLKRLTQLSDQSEAVATLARGEGLIVLGKEQDGFLNVETAKGGGWVQKVLVAR